MLMYQMAGSSSLVQKMISSDLSQHSTSRLPGGVTDSTTGFTISIHLAERTIDTGTRCETTMAFGPGQSTMTCTCPAPSFFGSSGTGPTIRLLLALQPREKVSSRRSGILVSFVCSLSPGLSSLLYSYSFNAYTHTSYLPLREISALGHRSTWSCPFVQPSLIAS
jgi:hypothetical protein